MKIAFHGRNLFGMHLEKSARELGHAAVCGEGRLVRCNIAFIAGFRNKELIEFYEKEKTPVFIFEQGYMKRTSDHTNRESGYWQLSKAKLNGIPEFPCPSDRFNELGLNVSERGGDPGGYVLVLGQKPGDSALNGTDHVGWLRDKFERYDNVSYRPHPKDGWAFDESEVKEIDGTLDEAIAGARLVVCYNSTAGFSALLAGVPVDCDECSPYYCVSGNSSKKERLEMLSRAAYGQWLVRESSQALNFAINWAEK